MSSTSWKDKAKGAAKKTTDAPAKKGKGKASPGTSDDESKRPKPIPPPPNKVPAYYNCMTGSYFTRVADGNYERTSERILSYDLRASGYYRDEIGANSLSWLEEEMRRLTKEQSVHFAGEVGGFGPGVHKMGLSRVLVTRGAEWIQPVEGKWPTLRDFFTQLLGDQAKYLYGWIKWALDSLRRGLPWSPGQMLAIAGPTGAGKSFCQSLLTPILGGRVSSPYKVMTDATNFNDDVWGCEHALIGDKNHAIDIRSRRNFGSAIKDFVANKEQRIEGKNKTAATLFPFIRLSLTLNDNPEALLVLPPLDRDIVDKIILLHAKRIAFPWPSKAFPDSQAYNDKLLSELPAFLWHLRRWRIPATIACQRYGIKSYLNPELVHEVEKLSPERKLWEAIDTYIFADKFRDSWEGGASELERDLEREMKGGAASRLFPFSTACGVYLSKLHVSLPESIFGFSIGKNKKAYSILRPGRIHGVDCTFECECRIER